MSLRKGATITLSRTSRSLVLRLPKLPPAPLMDNTRTTRCSMPMLKNPADDPFLHLKVLQHDNTQ